MSISALNADARQTRVWLRFAATVRRSRNAGSHSCEAPKRLRTEALADGMEPSEIPPALLGITGTLHRSSNFDWNVWHPLPERAGISDDFSDAE